MIRKLKAWLKARRFRRSTQRELLLAARLEAKEHEAATYKGHYERLQADFASLWDDHQDLQIRYAEVRYPAMQDWTLPRQGARI